MNDLSTRLHDLADDLAGPAPAVSASDAVARYRHRRRTRAGLIAVTAAVAVIAVGVPAVGSSLSSAPAAPATPAPATTAAPTTSSPIPTSAPEEKSPIASSAADDAAHLQELAALQAVAAQLTTPVTLTSPTAWDQWLPAGKPYPGSSTEEEMSTCPRLATGLSAALGQKMSYWIGTLPNGPMGCEWVPVPLSYDGPYDYAYLLSVGFLGDGTAPDGVAAYEHQGQPCPTVPLPAVDPQAVLTRCDTGTGTELQLTLPDARGKGTWVLDAQARTEAPHTATEALKALVQGVVQNYS
ncbi:hypothetical protein [Petropleomorpha daqingensis]|uniref:Uncharacterized protein n=1 Tax=Petropleomorpha daqingensis TaxID=2026353 RepID=A0A853CCS4_9ACTN|nr:hypothetical protein [Petropleomorpha daqingensis]NYJ05680.1 hypothetical protein [Petropleomorpha daqingensis]